MMAATTLRDLVRDYEVDLARVSLEKARNIADHVGQCYSLLADTVKDAHADLGEYLDRAQFHVDFVRQLLKRVYYCCDKKHKQAESDARRALQLILDTENGQCGQKILQILHPSPPPASVPGTPEPIEADLGYDLMSNTSSPFGKHRYQVSL